MYVPTPLFLITLELALLRHVIPPLTESMRLG